MEHPSTASPGRPRSRLPIEPQGHEIATQGETFQGSPLVAPFALAGQRVMIVAQPPQGSPPRQAAPPMSPPASRMAAIVELQRVLTRMFHNQVPDPTFVRSLRNTLGEWSRTVLTAGEELGPSPPSASETVRGLELARSPVFICGTARAGTTLLRDLLDGHPELVVIPVESGFYGKERPLMNLRGDLHRAYFTTCWLESLAWAPPSWLLPSTKSGSPYVAFARDFAGWWNLAEHHQAARNPSWPLATFALAFGQQLNGGRLPDRARMWVEKTPYHWRFVHRIWQDFPAAKVIQIVRRPEAVLASYKAAARRMPPHRVSARQTASHILTGMAPAYRLAATSKCKRAESRYHLVRYEDLAADPKTTMDDVARFLGIKAQPSLLQPTVAGRPAIGNSSFGTRRPDISAILDPLDRTLLALSIGRNAAKLGYCDQYAPAKHAIVG